MRSVSLGSPDYPSGFKRRDKTAVRRLEIEMTISSFQKVCVYILVYVFVEDEWEKKLPREEMGQMKSRREFPRTALSMLRYNECLLCPSSEKD